MFKSINELISFFLNKWNIKDGIEEINVLQEEWKTVIQVQMHFNDLIIKFRLWILTIFITFIWWIFAYLNTIQRNNETANEDFFSLLLVFPLIFIICGFLLDFIYYSKLLLSSVEFWKKFDKLAISLKYNLFWLSTRICKEATKVDYYLSLILFYLLPWIVYLIFLRFIISK